MKTIPNKTIADRFGRSASSYHQEATIQKKVAEGLIASMRPWKDIIPNGPFLEVGCGTGFLTEYLVKEFPNREMVITDASGEMVEFAKTNLNHPENLTFEVLDADDIEVKEAKYALVVSNFSAQWFKDPAISLEKLGQMLLPGGLLLITFPGNHSFEEWYKNCLELGLPFTANPFPDVEELVIKLSVGPMQIDYYENDLHQEFDSALDFFRHLKGIGADSSKTGKALNQKQLRLLTNHWDKKVFGKIKIKWHIVYLAAKKDMI